MMEGPSNIKPESGPEPEKAVPSFEEQWANPERVQIGTRVIEVEDIRPEKQKTEVPTIIGLGWSETPKAHKANIQMLMEHGRRVISPDTPHGVEVEPMENYPTIELRKMAALIETLETKGDGFYSTKGSHNSYFLDPKPYSLLIDNALDALERKSQKRTKGLETAS